MPRTNAQIEAAEQIYKAAEDKYLPELERLRRQLKEETFAIEYAAKIKVKDSDEAMARLLRVMMLRKVKEELKRQGKWTEFCRKNDIDIKKADYEIGKLGEFRDETLLKFGSAFGCEINKIKYLTSGEHSEKLGVEVVPEERCVIVNNQKIPLEPDEIKAIIEAKEERLKKIQEEKEAEIKAKERIIKAKEDVINRQEKEIRQLEKSMAVDVSGLDPEVVEQIELLKKIEGDFVAGISEIRKKIPFDNAAPEVLRQLYFLYIFISKVAMEERLALNNVYADAEEVPWEIIEDEIPPASVLVDNLPLSRGMGQKVKEKTGNNGD
ncbi:MAG: hypothetical protein GXP49_11515 [Deltaproteobacteria bacterium]|nr:hypothetical protein [Deltaproteobacteria bacterium]